MCGIYTITNSIDNKTYVGSSVNHRKRWNKHRADLRNNRHSNKHLQNAWNKYGEVSFTFELIEECTKEELIEKEQAWFNKLSETKEMFNLGPIVASPTLGSSWSEERKQLMSQKFKGRPLSDETKKKLSLALKGRPSPNKGRTQAVSEETKKKLSEAATKFWDKQGRKNIDRKAS